MTTPVPTVATPAPAAPTVAIAPAPVPTTPAAASAAAPAVYPTTPAASTTVAIVPALTNRPKMGGVLDDNTVDATAWTGGQPKVDWSGLALDAVGRKPSQFAPNCARPSKSSEKSKAHNLRITALSTPFKIGNDNYSLEAFSADVLYHLQDTGMDTIMFVPSESDPTKMVNVVEDYEQVTLEHVAFETGKCALLSHDAFDTENDRVARKFLELSIEPSLFQDLRIRQLKTDSAATTWMRILSLSCDGSVERYNRQKAELKALTPLTEPGESISLYASKARKLCKGLEQAKQFEWMLILSIVKALCTCSVESFRALWYHKRDALDTHLLKSSFMTTTAANKFMTDLGYHYTQVLQEAEQSYRRRVENGDCPPANSVKDTQQAPGAFFAGMDEAAFNALVQTKVDQGIKAASGKDSKIVCYTCNGIGHTKNECPNNKTNKNPDPDGPGHWRSIPPKAGEPSTKTVNGRILHFCTKCKGGKGFWTGTHETSTHGAKADTPAPAATIIAPQANLAGMDDGLGIHQF